MKTMYRVMSLALVALVACAILAITTSTVDTTYLVSELTSAFASAVGLSREFYRRALMSINIDNPLMVHTRAFAVYQLRTFHRAAEALLTPYISVCRHIITDAIEEYPLLRLAEKYLLPQPSYEDLTFHAERGECVWTKSSTGLPADFSPHTGTLFLLLATNICTAIFCLSIGTTILALLRIVWRSTKTLVGPAGKHKVTLETVLENLAPALANIFAAGINAMVFCATGLLFCVFSIVDYAANLDYGSLMKRPAPQDEPRPVFYRTLPDPRVPELEEKARKLENEIEEKDKNFEAYYKEAAATIHDLYGQNEVLEEANMAQKKVLRGHMKMHGEIDLTRSMYVQLKETQQQRDAIQEDYNQAIEEKMELESGFWKQLGDKCEDIKSLKFSLRDQKEKCAELARSQEFHQERARKGDEMSRLSAEFYRGRIQELEKLMASQKEAMDARIKELLELIATHEATIKSLEAQLKERDEVINTQKETIQTLEARVKGQDARHSSEQKSQKAYLMKGFERERKKLVDLSRLSSEARKVAEEKYKAAEEARKVADEAREAAEQARKTEEEARKTAEKDSAANLEARKTAEETCKAAEEKLEAATKALKAAEDARKAAEEESASLREQLANRPASHDQGTQTSSPPPSPKKTPPGPPTTKPPGPPAQAPAPAGNQCPPRGQRPMLSSRGVHSKIAAPKDPLFPEAPFSFSAPATPNIPGTNPAAPALGPANPPAAPTAPAPSAPEPTITPAGSSNPGPTNPPAGPSAPPPSTPPKPSTPPATPSAPAPSTPEPKTPPAAPSTPEPTSLPGSPELMELLAGPSTPEPNTPSAAPSTPEPKTPEVAPSTPELTSLPGSPELMELLAGSSTPEPTTPPPAPATPELTSLPASPEPSTPPAAPSTAEPAPAEGSPGMSSGGSRESEQPEAANSTPAEASPAKPASPSGEPTEAPKPTSA